MQNADANQNMQIKTSVVIAYAAHKQVVVSYLPKIHKGFFLNLVLGKLVKHIQQRTISPVWKVTWQLCHFTNSIWIWSGNRADIQLAVTLLLDFGYHSLKGGAAADGEECLRGDAIGNALKALLHKRFTL